MGASTYHLNDPKNIIEYLKQIWGIVLSIEALPVSTPPLDGYTKSLWNNRGPSELQQT